jgi:hypothetical protein
MLPFVVIVVGSESLNCFHCNFLFQTDCTPQYGHATKAVVTIQAADILCMKTSVGALLDDACNCRNRTSANTCESP